MKKVSMLQLKKNTHKILKNVPVIVTSGGKPAYVIKPYEELGELEYRGIPITKEELIPPGAAYYLNTTDAFYVQPEKPTPTFWQRVKNLLKKKII